MPKFDYDVVVIGGGAGGLTASIWSASLGSRTCIIEKEEMLGGDCLHYGCVPSKSLIKSAYVRHLIMKSKDFGLPEVEIPKVDFARVRDRVQGIVGRIQKNDSPDFFKKKYNIDTRFGGPKFTDKHTLIIDGQKLTSAKFILATGSSPRIPPIEGLDGVPYITNIDVFSLDQMPEQMIVLGGGPIGIEMAQAFHRLGARVTVVETSDCILPKEDKDVSCYIHELLEGEGIRFFNRSRAVKAVQRERKIALTVDTEGRSSEIQADCLLVATGRQPNVEGLDLSNAQVRFSERGIGVNRHLRTSAANIFAVGDCKGGFLFTHVAESDGRIAALNAKLPFPLLKTNYSTLPWCTFTDPEVASVGMNETMAKKAGIDFRVYKYEFSDIDRALAEGETRGFIKIIADRRKRAIGAQIVGLHAGELISEWVAIINGRVDIGKIEKTIHIYPTLGQINKKVAGSFLSSLGPLDKIVTYLFK